MTYVLQAMDALSWCSTAVCRGIIDVGLHSDILTLLDQCPVHTDDDADSDGVVVSQLVEPLVNVLHHVVINVHPAARQTLRHCGAVHILHRLQPLLDHSTTQVTPPQHCLLSFISRKPPKCWLQSHSFCLSLQDAVTINKKARCR